LPGVFTANSLNAVNGALWTLKIEVIFYLFVPVLHLLCTRFGTKKVMSTVFVLSCLWKYGFAWLAGVANSQNADSLGDPRNIYAKLDVQFPAQLVYFGAGILLLLYFDKLKHHFLSISAIAAFLYLVDHFFAAGLLDVFWISGLVFAFGFWRYFGNFSKYGDFSYGVYIVHWPILQTMIALGLVTLNPALFFILSLCSVGLASVLMWYLVERRFLRTSSHYRESAGKGHA
jgi:peptidoglycan/LPS O-acetylase OafA/YrhL